MLLDKDFLPLKSTISGLLALFLVLKTKTAFAGGGMVVSGNVEVVVSGIGVVVTSGVVSVQA